jgi:hypothetical protein
MAHMQISTEISTWLLQAKEFLDEARRLKPGAARNELRQVAKELRELAKFEAQSGSPDRRHSPRFHRAVNDFDSTRRCQRSVE